MINPHEFADRYDDRSENPDAVCHMCGAKVPKEYKYDWMLLNSLFDFLSNVMAVCIGFYMILSELLHEDANGEQDD